MDIIIKKFLNILNLKLFKNIEIKKKNFYGLYKDINGDWGLGIWGLGFGGGGGGGWGGGAPPATPQPHTRPTTHQTKKSN